MNKALGLRFGDLILDETCLFASRNGQMIQFTRNERALLLALTRNPQRLMRRGRLLDEVASESDISDRNIDFLVNRLRAKLGDSARSPKYIATQYGEGYIWIAAPSPALPIDAFLVIAPSFGPQGHPFSKQASSLVGQIRDIVAAGLDQKIAVADDWRPAATDTLRYFLQMSFLGGDGQLDCAATLREMPSKRILKALRLDLDIADPESFTAEATRIANEVVGDLSQALIDASRGLGTPVDEPLEARLHKAASLLSVSNPSWLASGEQLSRDRAQDPLNTDIALQWCLHLFARVILTSPFGGMSLEERYRIESEIDATVLECLPAIEANPLLMVAAAKLLYFINRGHLDLAEDIAERAFARTADFAAALPILGQLRYARGRFDEAVKFFDRGIEMAELGPALHLHMRVLKCIALLAAGDRAALEAAAVDIGNMGPLCPPEIALMIGWMVAAPDQTPPAADALAALGPVGAASAVEYLYFTSARHLVSEQARANVMRGLITHARRLHGEEAVPAFVLRSIGSIAPG
ncbi:MULTISPECIES: winged helix-turn-helix domain-containing protein [Bradyrhizobium]|uniref:Response regulator with CheY-like receiver domain and winged-helix DNA-binding domain n=2 Tax=Bradyrhizobium TaxID=374 RepID=A0A2U3PVG8_9BRAD|nr:helix-turn-helix domain-containing protein [Bradyrhizobium vignae]SPP93143.1 Response regulator with CheY-like receiver domain and winged-helix DNA-binding domain [Bradyrhizobium vignae]